MVQRFGKALKGWYRWKLLKCRYLIKKDFRVILFSEPYGELNEAALEYLPDFLQKSYCSSAVLLTVEEETYIKAREMIAEAVPWKKYRIKVLHISQEYCCDILAYYSLCKFSEQFTLISLNKPYGNWGYKLIDRNGITIKELVCLGIYVLRKIPEGQGYDRP